MEAQIKKMQEMFNKSLEELKSKQAEMNNTITEMKNTLEGINGRVTEAEEQISEREDRMVEITAVEQKLRKEYEEMMTFYENSETTLNASTFALQGSQQKRERKDLRKYFKR